ncbi:prolyl oligopeptidase family protein [Bradyrhizobium sp. YR681]|uniref:alpha/beta hydrolase family protein n=1 Tax=Bradyrhizobium sp. YR681 TaxID=1144344 RepID=UPI00026FB1B6|nr:prolyl oligopeptidase family serine peptidase [Bradyrhizobium sp. YR681]EJN05765.1 prolyl oligopeptidase family protein [Bradyrhizobium sp. YR681]
MIRFPILAELPTTPFSGTEVVRGVECSASDGDGPGRVLVEVDGRPDVLAFYGAAPEGAPADPVIFLRGDTVEKRDDGVVATAWYVAATAYDMQAVAEQLSASFHRPYVHLARPGILGSSGHHLDRRRPREVALVDAALTRLKAHFGWRRLNLVGQSGGGHLVAALIARRDDIGCAVITSGNTAVAQRNRENGWSADITGHSDFLDPIDHVAEVARHPPQKIIVLTDPHDQRVSASVQTAYVEALRRVGVTVDHRLLPAAGTLRHDLQLPGILAAFIWLASQDA